MAEQKAKKLIGEKTDTSVAEMAAEDAKRLATAKIDGVSVIFDQGKIKTAHEVTKAEIDDVKNVVDDQLAILEKTAKPSKRAPRAKDSVPREPKKVESQRTFIPPKRLNGTTLADAIDSLTDEQIKDSGMGVLKAVLHRHAKRSISMMDAIINVILDLLSKDYQF